MTLICRYFCNTTDRKKNEISLSTISKYCAKIQVIKSSRRFCILAKGERKVKFLNDLRKSPKSALFFCKSPKFSDKTYF